MTTVRADGVEASLAAADQTRPDVELVHHREAPQVHPDAPQVHGDFVDLARRVAERSPVNRSRRPDWRRYVWLLWVVPTFLACSLGAATVIFLLTATS
jgi:hypothetical protein